MDYSDSLDQFCLEADQQFDQLLSQMSEKQLTEILETTQTSFPFPVEQQPHPARFAEPKSNSEVQQAQASAVPDNTQRTTAWCLNIWHEWSASRRERSYDYPPPPHICTVKQLNEWLCNFVLEIRRKDGNKYPPNTLYSVCCGILRHVRSYLPEINFFNQPEFDAFRRTLDGEMKRLRSQGLGVKKKRAEALTIEDEDKLWEEGLLGATTPHTLLDTMVYMCGLYFALRSGKEHRDLQYSQIKLVESDRSSHIIYTENVSKNNTGGLQHRKHEPKVVTHYANLDNPSRCFVKLYKEYIEHCPSERKSNSFYLTPLKKPKGSIWYSVMPVGHNTLSKTVCRLCNMAGINGYKTNHSLRVTTATRLFQSGVDEQLIMARTGHRSLDGIRTYKTSISYTKQYW